MPVPGVPDGKRLSQAEIERRLRPTESEREQDVLDAATAGSFKPSMRVPWVVVTTLVTALVSILSTYFTTHAGPVDCASRGDLNALDKRLSQQGEDIRALTMTVNRNADQQHNDISILNGMLVTLTRTK